jgi:hypothetical protein
MTADRSGGRADQAAATDALSEAEALLTAPRLQRWVRLRSPQFARLLWGVHAAPPDHRLTRWVFLRVLGAIYLVAIVSLWVQIEGLIGRGGILPAADYLARTRQGAEAAGLEGPLFRHLPTLCWISAGDVMLHGLCALGALLSLLLIIGVAPVPALIGLWVIYLSLLNVGQEFLSFQWDILLLETGFLAIFFAPLQLLPSRPSREAPPSRAVLFLLRLLLFKLMFSSGVTKLTWNDATWWDLTALTYHYQTQPLPAWTSWYAHHLPEWFHRLSCAVTYLIEIALPFLIFAPRRLRLAAAVGTTGLMLLIGLTGNYSFFNLLALALCVPLLDDAMWPRPLRLWLLREPAPEIRAHRLRWPWWFTVPLAGLIVLLTVVPLARTSNGRLQPPPDLVGLNRRVAPFHLVNGYGLFRTMTTSRPEILLEGSDDGLTWRPYEFKWKPGDPARRPAFVEPHQPRLDWQMWFAALEVERSGRPPRWLLRLCGRLLSGSPEVLALLADNPFPDAPPRALRATLQDYQFTTGAERRATGAWWKRESLGVFLPEMRLRSEGQRQAGGRR